MSSLRRFVYLVMGDQRRRAYLLHRIDTSRCFLPTPTDDTPPPLEEARLPRAAMKFDAPDGYASGSSLVFMPFAGGGDGRRNRVAAADYLGRALLYDPESPSIRSLPSLTNPESSTTSITVGDDVYVLDTGPMYASEKRHCFKAFVYDDDEWRCHPLPPPPYVVHNRRVVFDYGTVVGSYAVVGGGGGGASSIWVSNLGDGGGTYSFDTASRAWTWAKVSDRELPFRGHVHHVPELGVWVGVSYVNCYWYDDGIACTTDLTAAAAGDGRLMIWRDPAPPRLENCRPAVFTLVHLGGSRFCYARFFKVNRPRYLCDRLVLTGIEVERRRRGEGDDGGELRVVKHRSRQYRLPFESTMHGVL